MIPEDALSRLLGEHADTITPAPGLDRIRARIAERRPWWRRAWDRLTRHTCDWRGDWLDPDTPRCRICGRRYETAAPGESGTAAAAAPIREDTAMTIIPRRAREVHAGDVITHDPDHDRPVRWRVTAPAVASPCGEQAIIDYTDLSDGGTGIVHYPALTVLRVELAGGGASAPAPRTGQCAHCRSYITHRYGAWWHDDNGSEECEPGYSQEFAEPIDGPAGGAR